jgi:hypothetical protein
MYILYRFGVESDGVIMEKNCTPLSYIYEIKKVVDLGLPIANIPRHAK